MALLPHDFPAWKSVYGYFARWREDGTLEAIHYRLFVLTRLLGGRNAQPSAGILNSQSVKTTEKRGGDDTRKKVDGRNRHLRVETQGLLIRVQVHPADVQDRARLVLQKLSAKYPYIKRLWADGAYAGPLQHWMQTGGAGQRMHLQIVKRSDAQKGFQVLPRRWVVERTRAWVGRWGRMSKDYEMLPRTGEALIYLCMIQLMLCRLTTCAF